MNKIILFSILAVILLNVSFTSISALSPENEQKLNDKLKSLEKQIKELIAENTKLKTENTKLKTENTKLKTTPQTTPQTANVKGTEFLYELDRVSFMSMRYPSDSNKYANQNMNGQSGTVNSPKMHVATFSQNPLSYTADASIGLSNSLDIFTAGAGVHFPYTPSEVSTLLDDMIKVSRSYCEGAGMEDGYPDLHYTCKNFQAISSKTITIDNLPAYQIVFSETRTPLSGDSEFKVTYWKINVPFKLLKNTFNDFDFEFHISQKPNQYDLTNQKEMDKDVQQFEKMMREYVNTIKLPHAHN